MRTLILFAAVILATCLCEKHSEYHSKLDQVVYIYPNNVNKDKDLELCQPNAVCGVVNQRFWYPPYVQRYCRCSDTPCPFSWSENDNRSVPLDNRSQLKTCDDTRNMQRCERNDVGLAVSEVLDPVSGQYLKSATILCYCDWPAYWKLDRREANSTHTYNEYTCSKLTRCKSGEFCGHMRADIYSTYYQCSCPRDHLCIKTDDVRRNVTEPLYNGPMLKAQCTPYHPNSV
ncbi:hypothetical protein GE061_000791 [Apolygus lucorum]|uniref:Uncharacterized protein n=1 Tax=Apolygus lucorum TaxID=248454 RepID=A0A8S9Y6U9_APOLU|nr:hypothetical protein GE061_000791 [Apolygus lucorum]